MLLMLTSTNFQHIIWRLSGTFKEQISLGLNIVGNLLEVMLYNEREQSK